MAAESIPSNGTLYSVSSITAVDYDVICIGSGWAARPIAERAIKAGLTGLLVDNELMGGDCPFWACVPSKALLRPSEALHAASAVGGAREKVAVNMVDVKAVLARRDAFTRGGDDEKLLVPAILNTGTDLLRGTGKLVGEKQVEVTSRDGKVVILTARHAVAICTGSVPIIPDIKGLQDAKPWTPRNATSSSRVPGHLVILGGGAVGCEMATAYRSLGAEITLITSGVEILPKIDQKAARIVRSALEGRRVRVLRETSVTEVERKADGKIVIQTSTGSSLIASEILVATGRKPRTEGCGLETFGIPVNGYFVEVDESLRIKAVAGNWLYAVGDINGRATLTHSAKYQARIAANSILLHAKRQQEMVETAWAATSATADHLATPQVVFTQPAVASVGLTQASAKLANKAVRIIEASAASVGALLHNEAFGEAWAQWIVEEQTGKLLGMTIVGTDVTELLHPATVAIVGGMKLDQLRHAIPCFPTMSEVYLNLAAAAGL